MVLMGTSAKSGLLSVIATGVFTDGGTVSTGALRLGGGELRLSSSGGPPTIRFSKATCLQRLVAHGTYSFGHGTGKYRATTGSGKFTTIVREVFAHKATGSCRLVRPLAFQMIVTLIGSATQR
jgi:hypothetical protein